MTVKLRTVLRHPSRIDGGTAIAATKENGVVTIDLDLSEQADSVGIVDTAETRVLLYTPGENDDDPDVYEVMNIDNLFAIGVPDESITYAKIQDISDDSLVLGSFRGS
jgi:hypothetical protein